MENILLPLSEEIMRKSIKDYKMKCDKKIPRAMAIAFTDTHMIVATCGRKNGYIALWKHDYFLSKHYIESRIIEDNQYISGKIMANLNPDFDEEIEKAVEEIRKKSKYARERTLPWPYNNCAEPHVITVSGRAKEIFGEHVGNMKYMAVYKINHKTMEFTEFQRCDYCKITTSNKYHPDLIILTDQFN